MSINTEIHWCDSTENPGAGCCGCELRNADINACYAGNDHDRKDAWTARQAAIGKTTGFARTFEDVTRFPGRVAAAARWPGLRGLGRDHKPWLNGAPRMIFLSDEGDVLAPHKSIWIDGGYRPVEPNTDFLYLTNEIIKNVSSPDGQRHIWLWLSKQMHRAAEFARWLTAVGVPWPSNLWLGTSVTEPKYLCRVDQLLGLGDDSMTCFLSIEPLVAPVSLGDRLRDDKIAWVIVGGESGARGDRPHVLGRHVARPFDLEWARAIARQCSEANVAFFVKQLGTTPHDGGKPLRLRDPHGGDWHAWPHDLAVREVPGVDRKWSRP